MDWAGVRGVEARDSATTTWKAILEEVAWHDCPYLLKMDTWEAGGHHILRVVVLETSYEVLNSIRD
jgi:hypothetical protein